MGTKPSEIIDVHLYDPMAASLFGKDKKSCAFAEVFYCSNKDNCGIYKDGGCVKRDLVGLGGRGHCPYSSSQKTTGYSWRASKFHSWISDIKTKYKDHLFALNKPKEKLYEVGDYYYLPYITLTWLWESKFKNLLDGRFIKKSDLTAEVLAQILSYRPQAMMGGEIRDYQQKDIPNLIKSIIRYSPELADLLKETGLNIDFTVPSNVGRKAVLQTLNKNIEVKIKNDTFFWNGTTLKALTKVSVINFLPGSWECILTPDKNIDVIVENENQVNEATEYSS